MSLGTFRLATFGQSFQWTDRERVAEATYDLLEHRGVLALVSHIVEGRPIPEGPAESPIPHTAIRPLVERFLGPELRAGRGFAIASREHFEDVLSRTRFRTAERLYAAGGPDIVQDIDGVIANYLSMSFCAPRLFGNRLGEFQSEMRRLLEAHPTSGLFWDWPGDTQILIARRSE